MGAILAIDQGTSGSRCLVLDEQGRELATAAGRLAQRYPRAGWVEQDPGEIREVTLTAAREALARAGLRAADLAALGITNQRESVCAWDPRSGEPLAPALLWQDGRTAARCRELEAAGLGPLVRERTGLVLDPYFSATKLEWLLGHVEGLPERVRTGTAVFGTIDSWLCHVLTGEHLTDASNASRTLLFDIASSCWDPQLLEIFGVPRRAMPALAESAGAIALTRPEVLGGHRVPLTGIAGDQQAALFGQGCLRAGLGKITYGTGSFALMNAGSEPPPAGEGLLATVAWRIDGASTYAMEASIFTTGAGVEWLREPLGLIGAPDETEALAASLAGNEGVYFVPALTGLGSPHWDPQARGLIMGLARDSGRAHLARATLEAIAYQTVDAVRAMERVTGRPLRELRVDGGATANRWLMQFQADVLGVPVILSAGPQATIFGAGLLAGVGAGLWRQADVEAIRGEAARYEPSMGQAERERLLDGWGRAVAAARNLARGSE